MIGTNPIPALIIGAILVIMLMIYQEAEDSIFPAILAYFGVIICIVACVSLTKAKVCSQIVITPADKTKEPIFYVGRDVYQRKDIITFIDAEGEKQTINTGAFTNSTFSIKETESSACETSDSK